MRQQANPVFSNSSLLLSLITTNATEEGQKPGGRRNSWKTIFLRLADGSESVYVVSCYVVSSYRTE